MKPESSKTILYFPGCNDWTRYSPSLLVVAGKVKFVSSCVTVIVTLGTTEPEGSVTRPVSVEVPICAKLGDNKNDIKKHTTVENGLHKLLLGLDVTTPEPIDPHFVYGKLAELSWKRKTEVKQENSDMSVTAWVVQARISRTTRP